MNLRNKRAPCEDAESRELLHLKGLRCLGFPVHSWTHWSLLSTV